MSHNSVVSEIEIQEKIYSRDLFKFNNAKQSLEELDKQILLHQRAVDLANACLEKDQVFRKYFEDIQSEGLSCVYDQDFVFKFEPQIDPETNKSKGYVPKVSRNGSPFRPLKSYGRGVRDVSYLIWDVALLIVVGQTRPLIFTDEPFSHLSDNLAVKLKDFIEDLCMRSSIQYFMITHTECFAGKVFRVSRVRKDKEEFSVVEVEQI